MAGYSGTPLLKKLGIKPGFRIFVYDPPAEYFAWLSPLPDDVNASARWTGRFDFIHLFVRDKRTFSAQLVKSKRYLKADGMIWVSWPKKSSGVKTDLNENVIRDFGLKSGLVDIKVCAVDDTWSGLKLVIPLSQRTG